MTQKENTMARWTGTLLVVMLVAGGVSAGVMILLPARSPVISSLGAASDVRAQINHQGVVTVGGVRFTGTGRFKFAIVDPGPPETLVWSNDGNSPPASEISLAVTDGVYSVALGDTTLMSAIARSLFSDGDLKLRVWFNDGSHGSEQLTPDQSLTSAPYAFAMADGAVTNAKVSESAAIAWSKVSKTGAVPGDVGAAATSHNHSAASITTGTLSIAFSARQNPSSPSLSSLTPRSLSSGLAEDVPTTTAGTGLLRQAATSTTATGRPDTWAR